MRRLVVICAILVMPACSAFVDDGPSNDTIKSSTGLMVTEASQIVADNFELISPNPHPVEVGAVRLGNGCRTDPNTLKSYGPPYTPHYQEVVLNPSPEYIETALANLEAMTARGFTRQEGIPGDDPASRVYRDSRGFAVYSIRDKTVRGEVEFTLFSSSPCAAE
ncbi:hypothetical protein ACFVJ5_29100 [Nocardia sp. NPDC127606]|uniref:hypothetical protein n=1 Tax=Nocardia sp. NPDC127606 TaxID=3345406 RepID=UPI003629777D